MRRTMTVIAKTAELLIERYQLYVQEEEEEEEEEEGGGSTHWESDNLNPSTKGVKRGSSA